MHLWVFTVIVLMVEASDLTLNDRGTCLGEVYITTPKAFRKGVKCYGEYKYRCKAEDAQKILRGRKNIHCCAKIDIQKQVECCVEWVYVRDQNICEPHCKSGCENGWCHEPDVCKCHPPFALHNNECLEPKCDPPCGLNSHCDNDTCKCDPSFDSFNTTHCAQVCGAGYVIDPVTLKCIPHCDNECIFATCTEPNVCTCVDGYKKKNDFVCIADCNPACFNADCTGPNTCSCHKDYKPDNSTHCSPICEVCENGDCVAPNNCECHEGYKKKQDICAPVCEQSCNKGICSKPNTCTCNSGYELDPKNKFNCLPICEQKCVNASCVSPNTCACYSGFERAGNNWTCKPKCDRCDHGKCVAPNLCNCDDGYSKTKVNGICSPQCTRRCVNAVCTAPEVCTCKEGYIKNDTNSFECHAPCQSGYELVNETCSRVECSECDFKCSADDDCWCKDGRQCFNVLKAEATTTGLASLEATWTLCGAVTLLLLVLMTVVMHRIWRRRKQIEAKAAEGNTYGSVMYTVPYMQRNLHNFVDEEANRDSPNDEQIDAVNELEAEKETNERLLTNDSSAHENV